MTNEFPLPTINRLCQIYNLLAELERTGTGKVSSSEMGMMLGISPQSIRKDISLVGDVSSTGARYDVAKLKAHLADKFGFDCERRACIVGVGRLGSAILDYGQLGIHGYTIIAGFDSNMNTIETKKTKVKLYPAYQIADVVQREKIELAVLCVPAQAAQGAADKLIDGGIRGIVNFTPAVITSKKDDVFVAQIDVVKEFRVLSAMISLSSGSRSSRSQ
jgi:redox-sensing transcriptional repressor